MVHADVTPERDVLTLAPAWNEVELLKLVPGAHYAARDKRWWMPFGFASLTTLRGVFGPALTYSDDVAALVWQERAERVDASLALRDRLTSLTRTPDSRLYDFQHAGVDFMLAAGSGLLGDELGVGKTVQALAYVAVNDLFPVFVVCPNSVKHHWATRVADWVPGATAYVLEGGAVKIRKTLAAAKLDERAVVIVNYESVRAYSRLAPYGSVRLRRCKACDPSHGEDVTPSRCHVHPKELNGFGFRVAIIDEIHHCGDPKSQQTRAVWSVVHDPSVGHRWGLTGTPDNVERLWTIMHTVCPREYPSRSLWLDRYALRSWNAFGGLDVVGLRPDTREELQRILDPRFRRMLLDVVMPQMPPVVREIRFSDLTPTMRRQYADLESKLYTVLPDGEVFITKNKLVARTRQLQFAAGSVVVDKPDEDDIGTWQVKIVEPSTKLDLLDETLDELGTSTPFVVACLHRDVVDLAAERLSRRGIQHQIIYAGVHPSIRTQACEDLKTGVLRAIVFTIDSGGEGLDMSGAGVMIRLQRSWSLINSVQTEGRTRRIGSERHEVIRIVDLVTRDTREEHQMQRLAEKMQQFDEINRDRLQVQQRLVEITPSDQEFTNLIRRLDDLNHAQALLLTFDDLDANPTQLEESA